jgi:hypothetical protein
MPEGLVSSLARPGGNVTGLAVLASRDVEGKRLELLHAAVPTAARVVVVLDSTGRLPYCHVSWKRASGRSAQHGYAAYTHGRVSSESARHET